MRYLKNILKHPLVISLIISCLTFLFIMGLRLNGRLESLELSAYDWLIRLRPETFNSESPITLITITEKDILNQGRWPLSDETLAQVLSITGMSRPCCIGLDIYRDVPVPPGTEKFEAVLTENPNIIAVMKFAGEKNDGIHPPAALENMNQVGFTDMIVDPGGIVRRGVLFLDDGSDVFFSLALRLALAHLQTKGITPQPGIKDPAYIRLGQTTISPFKSNDGGYVEADSRGYQFLIDWKGARKGFPSYSLTSLLSGKIAPEKIKDKIIIIGVTAESVKDSFYTPFSRGLQTDRQMSGVALHANIIGQLLRCGLEGNAVISTANRWAESLWILLWSLIGGGLAAFRVRSAWRLSLLAAAGLFVLGLAVFFAFMKGLWIPLVPPAMAWFISSATVTACMLSMEKKQRSLLMHLFSRHVSREVADAIWKEREQFMDGGRPRPQRLVASVLFTDLTGFTSVSERLDPQTLMAWLNEYMEAMAQLVIANDGVINKYIGDAVMAVFGVPLARKNESETGRDAVNAVNCALSMREKLIALNMAWQEKNLPAIGMRVGIFTGPLVAGSLGSAQRLEYTVIGDTVNTASRLESFDKESFVPDFAKNPCRIFIGESTLRYLDHRFKTQSVGKVILKGKDQATTVYSVTGREEGSQK